MSCLPSSITHALHVLQRDARLALPIPHLDSPDGLLGSEVQVHDDVGLLHKVTHVPEQLRRAEGEGGTAGGKIAFIYSLETC